MSSSLTNKQISDFMIGIMATLAKLRAENEQLKVKNEQLKVENRQLKVENQQLKVENQQYLEADEAVFAEQERLRELIEYKKDADQTTQLKEEEEQKKLTSIDVATRICDLADEEYAVMIEEKWEYYHRQCVKCVGPTQKIEDFYVIDKDRCCECCYDCRTLAGDDTGYFIASTLNYDEVQKDESYQGDGNGKYYCIGTTSQCRDFLEANIILKKNETICIRPVSNLYINNIN